MPRFIVSGMTDPYKNLSVEEFLFESMGGSDLILFLYINGDSVIIGRHQNPWMECPVERMERLGIPVLRRISGGGTVFHDGGNLNFSFMMSKGAFRKERNLTFILRALEKIGINGELSERGDILVSGRKISGNAQCFRHERSLHHGTILVRSDLDRLNSCVHGTEHGVETHAVASVRSSVTNLESHRPGLTPEDVADSVYEVFVSEFGERVRERIETLPEKAQALYEKNLSWEWVFGRSPAFSASVPFRYGNADGMLSLGVEDGIIMKAGFSSEGFETDLTSVLKGMRFDGNAPAKHEENYSSRERY